MKKTQPPALPSPHLPQDLTAAPDDAPWASNGLPLNQPTAIVIQYGRVRYDEPPRRVRGTVPSQSN